MSVIYVTNDDARNFAVTYEDGGSPAKRAALEAGWKRFQRPDPATGQSYNIWYRSTNHNKEVQVDHSMPAGSKAGRYRVEVFVPGKHATSRRVIFTVAHNFRVEQGQPAYDDTLSVVNMYDLFDVWYPLGEFDLDVGANPWSGRVRQYDLSLEEPPMEMAFGPVRWVPMFTQPGDAPKFDSPVGGQTEREGPFSMQPSKWVGSWFDSNPFLNWYFLGYHTGADLNLSMSADADKNAPIYAVADGVVIYAGQGSGKWGKIAVIEHPDAQVTLPNGQSQRQVVYSRYGHLSDQILIKKGDAVLRGQQIGFIGLALGVTSGWHLHFDISHSGMLKTRPSHWPDMTKVNALKAAGKTNTKEYRDAQAVILQAVVANYIDPLRFLKANHGV